MTTLKNVILKNYRTAVFRGEASPGDHGVGADVVHGTLDLDQAHIYTKFLGYHLVNLYNLVK